MNKEVRYFEFSNHDDETKQLFNSLVENNAHLAAASAFEHYGNMGLIEEVKVDNYKSEDFKARQAVLKFAAKCAGIDAPENVTDLAFAMDNSIFKSVLNTIYARTIRTMMVKYRSPQLEGLASIERVGVGDSLSLVIRSKALPQAQRGSYGSNNSSVFQEAAKSVTIKPVPYVIGRSLDYIRIFQEGYDWAYDIAKVYAGLQFAKYKLIADKIFTNASIQATPFYQANFTADGYVQLASDVSMFAGEAVTAFGTLVAWQSISALATNGGFSTKDEYIRNAYLQKIFGVDSMILSQITDAAAPFTSSTASSLRVIPDNKIVLIPNGGDKVVKLVEEDYIRAKEVDANDNNLNRMEYVFTQCFDAEVASGNPFGLQGTTVSA